MINVYIHIGVLGAVNQILSNLLGRINESGLYNSCDKIYLSFNGNANISKDLPDKYEVIYANPDLSKWEFPTLDLIWKHAQDIDSNILYLHTKGVTKPNVQQIVDWTNLMSYFNINKWQDRLKELEEYDCTGVNFFGNPEDIKLDPSTWGYGKAPQHYSGNFWWSKSSHIKKLPNPISWMPTEDYSKWRMLCEMWLCQLPNGKYYNAYSSEVDHYQNLYPEYLYKR